LINWVYNEPLPRAVSKVEGVKIAANLEPVDPHAPLPIKSTKENILPAKRKLEETESSYSSRVNSLINSLAEEAQKTQDTLLDLMGIAERHGWEMLYNAAVDVFREGEAGIERRYPSLAQIEKVYKMTSPDSAMRQFFCDYAYSLAKKTRMYQGICKRNSSRGTLSF
jgi:hypothetical protein